MANHGARSDNDFGIYANLFARLSQYLPEYVFDSTIQPFHSSYDNWHVIGSTRGCQRRGSGDFSSRDSLASSSSGSTGMTADHVVARVTQNGLRIEREYKQAQMLYSEDSDYMDHFARPLRLVRIPAQKAGEIALVVSVIKAPSLDYMDEIASLKIPYKRESASRRWTRPTLSTFLDFAVGSCASLEVLHHKYGLVHGEIRMDAFHFDHTTTAVRFVNLGSGVRSFTSRLTSTGWTSLLSELGVRYKLQFFAPEQTGRLAAEPDMRTDIYALGVGFWAYLTGSMPFKGNEPLEIIQSVLSQQLPSIQSYRSDIPDSIAMIIAKMTRKTITDRYNSISSTKQDFMLVRDYLSGGNVEALADFKVAQDDVSANFILPTKLVGRKSERQLILNAIDTAAEKIQLVLDQNKLPQGNVSSPGRNASTQSSETIKSLPHTVPPASKSAWLRRRSVQTLSSLDSSRMLASLAIQENTVADNFVQIDEQITHIITITGESGIGKTFFMRNLQPTIRQTALFARAQFEKARTQPLEPILQLISALFRQIFSESNVNSARHAAIRQQVGPYWASICAHLELPPWLLDTDQLSPDVFLNGSAKTPRRSWLDCAGINQTSRFMQVLLQVLRAVAFQKTLCLCLDDIDMADEESLDLVNAMVHANLPLILVLIYKQDGARKVQMDILSDNGIKLDLGPFTEDETAMYVAELIGPLDSQGRVLASIVYDRTGGSPSYVRDFLDRCHSAGFISFSWRLRRWEIQIDKVAQCWPRSDDPQRSVEMTILSRFLKLSKSVRSLLSWAAVIGTRFSFTVLQAICDTDVRELELNVPLPMDDALASLNLAVSKFIVRPTDDDDSFEFADDSTYNAIWMLVKECNIQHMHYVIAKAMLEDQLDDTIDVRNSQVYAVAEHIMECLGVVQHVGTTEQQYLRSLLTAADLARATGALRKSASYYDAALELARGDMVHGDDAWTGEHSQLFVRAAEVFHLVNRTDDSLQLLDTIESQAHSLSQKTSIMIIRSRIHNAEGHGRSAFDILHEAIVELCETPLPTTLEECDDILERTELFQKPIAPTDVPSGVEVLLAEAVMASLFMTDITPYQCAIALILQSQSSIHPTNAIIGLLYLSAVALFRLGARTLTNVLRDKAMGLLSNTDMPYDTWSRALVLRTLLLGHLEVENSEQISKLTHALESSSSVSDRGFLLLNIAAIAMLRFMASDDLESLETFLEHSTLELPNWSRDHQNSLFIICVRQMTRALRGKTDVSQAHTVLCDHEHDSPTYIAELTRGEHHFCKVLYEGCQAIIMNMFGFATEAMEIGLRMMPYIHEARFSPCLNAVYYHTALAIATVLRTDEDRPDKAELLDVVKRIRSRIELIARSKAPVCQAWLLVLEAEIADDTSSLRLLNFAVEIVQDQHFALDEAICLELYAKCLARMGAHSAMFQLVQRCVSTYEQAGAHAKAKMMLAFANVLTLELTDAPATAASSTEETLEDDDEDAAHSELAPLPVAPQSRTRPRADSFMLHERLTSLFKTPVVEAPYVEETQCWLDEVDTHQSDSKLIEGLRTHSEHDSNVGSYSTPFSIGTLDVIDLHLIISSSQAMTSELQIDRLLQTLTKIIAASTSAEVCSIVIEDEDQRGWSVAATQPPNTDPSKPGHIMLNDLDNAIAKQVNTYVLRFREQIFIQNTHESDVFNNIFPNMGTMTEEVSIICMPMLQSETLLGSLYCQAPPNTFTDRTMTLVQLLVTQISISIHNAFLFKRLERASNNNLSMIELQKDTVKRAQQSEKKARMAETKAVENLKQKEEAMKAKGMFLANVSHELRTPLNGVIGMTTILQDTQLTAHQDDCCHNIRVCAETLVQIVNDILDYNKLEAGKMMVSNAPMNMYQTLSEVVNALRASHMKEDVTTIEHFDFDSSLIVMGDSIRLQQVLMNLMSNAYKFTPSGEVTVTAKIEKSNGDVLTFLVSVKDSGIGISPEQQKKLFMPFSQADDSTARSYGGTGLGLSICKSIVEGVLKGQIWMDSALGEGTRVSFRAPYQLADADAKQSPGAHQSSTSFADEEAVTAGAKRKWLHEKPDRIKICIAEDNPINRKIAMSYVKKLGYRYEAFEDGKQAVDALVAAKDFDLVLMDVQMPVLDGYDATKLLRQNSDQRVRDVIVIAMTASTIQGDKERCFEVGMDAYVAKPVRLETLKEAIRSFLADDDENVAPHEQVVPRRRSLFLPSLSEH